MGARQNQNHQEGLEGYCRFRYSFDEADPAWSCERYFLEAARGRERERRMDFVPEESAIKTDLIEVETMDLLQALNMGQLHGVVKQEAPAAGTNSGKPQTAGGLERNDQSQAFFCTIWPFKIYWLSNFVKLLFPRVYPISRWLFVNAVIEKGTQVGSPVISSNFASKEKPKSPLNTHSSCVSAVSNFSMPNTNATESSVPQKFQAFHGGCNQLGNIILKPREENTPSCISSFLTSAEEASGALSSVGSAGAGVTKIIKRRARINKKAPIAVLSADTSNFRAMVQRLTGIPPSHASPQMWGASRAALLRPQPTRFAYSGGLPMLDTSLVLIKFSPSCKEPSSP